MFDRGGFGIMFTLLKAAVRIPVRSAQERSCPMAPCGFPQGVRNDSGPKVLGKK
jgi:hypothetical protein